MRDETLPHRPRPRPCATCPYRRRVASGIWDETEYARLPDYDGETHEQQSIEVFLCHQGDGAVCSGWLGHRDPLDLLAVRIGLTIGVLDPACADYSTDVELHESGAAAAAHGVAEVESPGPAAVEAIDKLIRSRRRARG